MKKVKEAIAEAYAHLGVGPIGNEKTLDLSRNPLAKIIGNYQIGRSQKKIRINTNGSDKPSDWKKIPRLNNTIDLDKVAELYKRAMRHYNKEEHFFTAMRFHYGVMADSFLIVYEPLLFVVDEKLNDTQKIFSYEEKEKEAKDRLFFIVHQDEGLKEINYTVFDDCINEFRKKIRLNHSKDNKGPGFTEIIKEVDTDYAVFAFQEIFYVMYDNKVEKIWVYNTAIEDKHDPYTEIRHSILLAPNDRFGPEKFVSGEFKSMYANLAHLCPPHCKIIHRILEK